MTLFFKYPGKNIYKTMNILMLQQMKAKTKKDPNSVPFFAQRDISQKDQDNAVNHLAQA